ncbi:MAG: energy-coupling factor ABC transporter ATP-binding protein [Propionibacteriaceae bacterium]|nr:energy-coupling factor ABC transporter ATP-binding protein [Propionibacteriaceae bacterium]
MIHFDAVSHAYGERSVLTEISVELTEHRIGVIGGNGSGKSTLARLCNGLIIPTSGTVTVRGHNTKKDLAKVRRLVGFVFQDPDLQIIMPTVEEDLAFSLRPQRLPHDQVQARVDLWLKKFHLDSHRTHPAHLLSGGQKQLLAIAAILITEPEILIFDEPTTLLDLKNTRIVMNLIASLDQQVIVVTHDLDCLASFDRVIVVDNGRIVADGRPDEAITFYQHLISQSGLD